MLALDRISYVGILSNVKGTMDKKVLSGFEEEKDEKRVTQGI